MSAADDVMMRAENPEELELLLMFRALTPTRQSACLKMYEAMAAFRKAMQEGAAHA